ncbi:uncharacterized protein LOC114523220 [Dendronephthya gigantea]|uniref:uncharacterized protein LOC114523220 n=1 Tax=Dendronephthya gigantea TaxID=151771 RepID=UPI0010699300|nr:uncharacterized protein LOC114523220 [Dendronephthya gigantea]
MATEFTEDGREKTVERSPCLIGLGWVAFGLLYLSQVGLFISILVIHCENTSYVAWFLLFVPAILYIGWSFYKHNEFVFSDDVKIWDVWLSWGLYIIAYIITVATIFGTVAKDLTKDDGLGINALIGTLCITPALLVLLLQLTISPSYRKPVLSLSVFAALNIFDGIEMLEIFLMQKEGNFELGKALEICIVFFACFCFILSPLGLLRNKFVGNGEVKERKETSKFLGPLEIIGTNLPFLVLRSVIWHKYEAAIFIAKNAVALVVGAVEFVILTGMCKCGIKV